MASGLILPRSPLSQGAPSRDTDPRRLRRADSDWDFRGVDTKYATHGIYRYPAMMVAPFVRRLIDCLNHPITIIKMI